MKNQKGITLVALVITIVVLLILAGVTISMVMGDNGVLSNSQKAKYESAKGTAEDSLSAALSSITTDIYSGNYSSQSVSDLTQVTDAFLKTEIAEQMQGYTIVECVVSDSGEDFNLKINDKDYGYTATISKKSLTVKSFGFTNNDTHAKNS